MKRPPLAAALAAAALALCGAKAPDPVIARGGGATLTLGQARALVAALPPDAQARLATDPSALAGLLRDAILQAELMDRARKDGWDKRPEVIAAAERARQNAIVRSYVAHAADPAPTPTDDQLQPLYQANKARFMLPRQYRLAQIFLPLPADAAPAQVEQARLRLLALRAQANDAAAFGVVARRESKDSRSAAQGGDLGWIAEDKLVDPIKTAVAGMQVGAVSDPLRTSDGWHLIELVATQPAGPASFAQARPVLAQAYAQQQQQAATRRFLDGVLQASPVSIDTKGLKALQGAQP